MTESIAVTLGAGSGIDTRALVNSLVEAQFRAKSQSLTARRETLTAQISALSQLRSGLTGFSTALTNLVAGGTLSTQPVSADPEVLGVGLLPGASLAGLSASVEVRALAAAQVVTAASVADRTAAFGKGTLTITLGTMDWSGMMPTGFTPKAGASPVTVTIGDGQNSLSGIADAINAARAGVTATVITDASGARLSIKGPTGADQAFTVDAAEDPAAPGLARLAFSPASPTLSVNRRSEDAVLALDGVEVRRASNSVADLLPGVRLDLKRAAVGQSIAITTTPPTAALAQAVNDIVSTYNELLGVAKEGTNGTSGVLRSDQGVKDMLRMLGRLTGQDLNPSGAAGEPRTLAELGVATNRDGTLSVNTATLQAALAARPEAVERMVRVGFGAALRQVSLDLTAPGGALQSSQNGYTRVQSAIARDLEKIALDTETLRERLTRQYAGMDARVSAYKATQSFLDQQIQSWTNRA